MRIRPSLLLVVTAVAAFFVAQTALGSTPADTPPARVSFQPAAAVAQVQPQPRPQSEPRPAVPKPYRLAAIQRELAVSDRPGGPATGRIASTTEFGSPHVLGVAESRGDWLGVVTSARPNGELAWVRRGAGVTLQRTRWSLHADLSERRVVLRRNGRVVHRLAVAIGRAGSDTPTGRFAVTDKLAGSRFGAYYGCCILALSGHQPNTPPGWTGGDRLAIHGTDAPATIGSAASAGCLRAADADLEVLMAKVPLGTPVFIRS
jgi:lipoprotein-anchoring transpeptidase ErfK/SrfK